MQEEVTQKTIAKQARTWETDHAAAYEAGSRQQAQQTSTHLRFFDLGTPTLNHKMLVGIAPNPYTERRHLLLVSLILSAKKITAAMRCLLFTLRLLILFARPYIIYHGRF